MRLQVTIDEVDKLTTDQVAQTLRAVAEHVEQHGYKQRLVTSSIGLSMRYYLPDTLTPDLFT